MNDILKKQGSRNDLGILGQVGQKYVVSYRIFFFLHKNSIFYEVVRLFIPLL